MSENSDSRRKFRRGIPSRHLRRPNRRSQSLFGWQSVLPTAVPRCWHWRLPSTPVAGQFNTITVHHHLLHLKAPFAQYNLLSNRFDNRIKCLFTRYKGLSNPFDNRLSNPFDNRFDNRLDVCLHDYSWLSNQLYNWLYHVNRVWQSFSRRAWVSWFPLGFLSPPGMQTSMFGACPKPG